MQIPDNPFKLLGAGFLQQPQPGTDQQVRPDLQVKARAAGPATSPGAGSPARAAPAGKASPALANARTLEEAVHTLRSEGRLPLRGSLIDLRA